MQWFHSRKHNFYRISFLCISLLYINYQILVFMPFCLYLVSAGKYKPGFIYLFIYNSERSKNALLKFVCACMCTCQRHLPLRELLKQSSLSFSTPSRTFFFIYIFLFIYLFLQTPLLWCHILNQGLQVQSKLT